MLFQSNPAHPGLPFNKLEGEDNIDSVRAGLEPAPISELPCGPDSDNSIEFLTASNGVHRPLNLFPPRFLKSPARHASHTAALIAAMIRCSAVPR